MRIIVCGGRDYRERGAVNGYLDKLHKERGIERLAQGGAKGADMLALAWALVNEVISTTYFADWEQHGNSAGPIRNKLMLDEEKPDAVVAFPGGKGTAHMVKIAREAGVEVLEAP